MTNQVTVENTKEQLKQGSAGFKTIKNGDAPY